MFSTEQALAAVNPNHDLQPACGINVVLVLDASGSIDTTEQGQVRTAASTFIDALQDTGSQVAIVEFATLGDTPIAYTEVTSANMGIFNDYLSTSTSTPGPQYHDGRNSVDNGSTAYTNWDYAFHLVNLLATPPDLVVFVTDGDPTARGGYGSNALVTSSTSSQVANHLNAAESTANITKSNSGNQGSGSHIFAVGVGSGVSISNLERVTQQPADAYVSSPSNFPAADYTIGNFTSLAADLANIAKELCASSVTITKLVDPIGDGAAYTAQAGWTFTGAVTVSSGSYNWLSPSTAVGQNRSGATDANGELFFQWRPDNSNAASDITITESPQNNFTFVSVDCTVNGQSVPVAQTATFTIADIPSDGFAACTVRNKFNATPELTLSKRATPSTYDAVNQSITYSYIVTNTGNVALAGPVTVSDDKIVNPNAVTCPAVNTVGNNDGNLDANESITCTASYAITQADLDSGSVTNTATAAADNVTSNQATATVTAIKKPHLKLVKTGLLDMTVVNPNDEANPGDRIDYTLTATNDGNVTLHNVEITDTKLGTLICTPSQPVAALAPMATLSCTGSYTLTQDDIDAGQVLNSATAISDEAPDATDDETVAIPRTNELTLTKAGVLDLTTVSPSNRADVGDTIHYTLIVTNTGNTTLHTVQISDPKLGTLTCAQPVDLAPGAALSCTGSYTLTQPDIDAGQVLNTASADSNETNPVPATETVPVPKAPNLALTKVGVLDMTVVAPTDRADVGDQINYTLVATNTGNITLHNVIITDPKLGTLTCTPIAGSTLAVGAVMKCSGAYTLTQADIDAGQVDNTATADSNESQPTDASAAVPVPQIDHLALTKAGVLDLTVVAPSDRADVGDKINYTLVTTNTGNTTLTGVTITDAKLGALVCTPTAPATLAPGASMTCTGSYTLTQADIDAGKVDNTANADSDQTAPTPASKTVPIPPAPNIALTKTGLIDRTVVAPTNRADVGDKINYTLVTTNTGNVTLTGVSISDPKLGALACTPSAPAPLAPGAAMTCTGSYTITQADLNAGTFVNTATASGTDPAGTKVSDEETVTKSFGQVVSLTLSKSTATVNYDAVNDVINYTLVTTNTGNTTLTNVSISDPKLATLTCTPAQPTTLAPGASMSCTGSYSIVQGDIDAGRFDNTATAIGTGPQNQPASAEASKSVPAALAPHLALTKSDRIEL
ncbi:MAG: VWA domain-containing protein [Caldilineaceae bacterium]